MLCTAGAVIFCCLVFTSVRGLVEQFEKAEGEAFSDETTGSYQIEFETGSADHGLLPEKIGEETIPVSQSQTEASRNLGTTNDAILDPDGPKITGIQDSISPGSQRQSTVSSDTTQEVSSEMTESYSTRSALKLYEQGVAITHGEHTDDYEELFKTDESRTTLTEEDLRAGDHSDYRESVSASAERGYDGDDGSQMGAAGVINTSERLQNATYWSTAAMQRRDDQSTVDAGYGERHPEDVVSASSEQTLEQPTTWRPGIKPIAVPELENPGKTEGDGCPECYGETSTDAKSWENKSSSTVEHPYTTTTTNTTNATTTTTTAAAGATEVDSDYTHVSISIGKAGGDGLKNVLFTTAYPATSLPLATSNAANYNSQTQTQPDEYAALTDNSIIPQVLTSEDVPEYFTKQQFQVQFSRTTETEELLQKDTGGEEIDHVSIDTLHSTVLEVEEVQVTSLTQNRITEISPTQGQTEGGNITERFPLEHPTESNPTEKTAEPFDTWTDSSPEEIKTTSASTRLLEDSTTTEFQSISTELFAESTATMADRRETWINMTSLPDDSPATNRSLLLNLEDHVIGIALTLKIHADISDVEKQQQTKRRLRLTLEHQLNKAFLECPGYVHAEISSFRVGSVLAEGQLWFDASFLLTDANAVERILHHVTTYAIPEMTSPIPEGYIDSDWAPLLAKNLFAVQMDLWRSPCLHLDGACGKCLHCQHNSSAIWCQPDCMLDRHEICTADDFLFRSTSQKCTCAEFYLRICGSCVVFWVILAPVAAAAGITLLLTTVAVILLVRYKRRRQQNHFNAPPFSRNRVDRLLSCRASIWMNPRKDEKAGFWRKRNTLKHASGRHGNDISPPFGSFVVNPPSSNAMTTERQSNASCETFVTFGKRRLANHVGGFTIDDVTSDVTQEPKGEIFISRNLVGRQSEDSLLKDELLISLLRQSVQQDTPQEESPPRVDDPDVTRHVILNGTGQQEGTKFASFYI